MTFYCVISIVNIITYIIISYVMFDLFVILGAARVIVSSDKSHAGTLVVKSKNNCL